MFDVDIDQSQLPSSMIEVARHRAEITVLPGERIKKVN